MCLILIKPKGVPMSDTFYMQSEKAMDIWGGGVGYAILTPTSDVIWDKGIYTKSEIQGMIESNKVNEDDTLVFHARAAISPVKSGLCHPFPIVDYKDWHDESYKKILGWGDLMDTEIPVFFHNGAYNINFSQSKESDTYAFVKNFISQFQLHNSLQGIRAIRKFTEASHSRSVLLSPRFGIRIAGTFHKEEGTGFLHSNTAIIKGRHAAVNNLHVS